MLNDTLVVARLSCNGIHCTELQLCCCSTVYLLKQYNAVAPFPHKHKTSGVISVIDLWNNYLFKTVDRTCLGLEQAVDMFYVDLKKKSTKKRCDSLLH